MPSYFGQGYNKLYRIFLIYYVVIDIVSNKKSKYDLNKAIFILCLIFLFGAIFTLFRAWLFKYLLYFFF